MAKNDKVKEEQKFVVTTCGCHIGSKGTRSIATGRVAAVQRAGRIGKIESIWHPGIRAFLEGGVTIPNVVLMKSAPIDGEHCSSFGDDDHFAQIMPITEEF